MKGLDLEDFEGDIVDVLKEDHNHLKAYKRMMNDDTTSMKERKKAFEFFSNLLKSHSFAEEHVVYKSCHKIDSLKQDVDEGIVEHDLAEGVALKLLKTSDSDKWKAHAKVLDTLVEHHIREEETDLLPQIYEYFDADQRIAMAKEFIRLRTSHRQNRHADQEANLTH